jgi:hypothetical protein
MVTRMTRLNLPGLLLYTNTAQPHRYTASAPLDTRIAVSTSIAP